MPSCEFQPRGRKKQEEIACDVLSCLEDTWGIGFCLTLLGDRWEWWHSLDIRSEACGSSGGHCGTWMLQEGYTPTDTWVKRLWTEEYSRNLRPWEEELGCDSEENKTSKSKQENRGNWGKNTHMGLRKTHPQKRLERILSLHTELIREYLPLPRPNPQKPREGLFFSNVQFSTKYHKAYKETGKNGQLKKKKWYTRTESKES